jgi:hypothetical protein
MAVPRGTRSGIPDTVPIIGCGTANRNAECWVVIDCTATSKVFAQTRGSLSPQFVHQFPGPLSPHCLLISTKSGVAKSALATLIVGRGEVYACFG